VPAIESHYQRGGHPRRLHEIHNHTHIAQALGPLCARLSFAGAAAGAAADATSVDDVVYVLSQVSQFSDLRMRTDCDCPTTLHTGVGGDDGLAKLWNRREVSVGSKFGRIARSHVGRVHY
jgi:hypothetical protein